MGSSPRLCSVSSLREESPPPYNIRSLNTFQIHGHCVPALGPRSCAMFRRLDASHTGTRTLRGLAEGAWHHPRRVNFRVRGLPLSKNSGPGPGLVTLYLVRSHLTACVNANIEKPALAEGAPNQRQSLRLHLHQRLSRRQRRWQGRGSRACWLWRLEAPPPRLWRSRRG